MLLIETYCSLKNAIKEAYTQYWFTKIHFFQDFYAQKRKNFTKKINCFSYGDKKLLIRKKITNPSTPPPPTGENLLAH